MKINKEKIFNLLFNPFNSLSKNQTLIIGMVIIFLAGLINSFTNTHFDGIFDIHSGKDSAFIVFILEGYINLVIITGILYLVGKVFIKTDANILSLFGQQALARWPLLISSIITISGPYQRFCNNTSRQQLETFGIFNFNSFDEIIVSLSLILMLIVTIWVIVLMYKSFSKLYKVQDTKGIFLFIFGSLIAEVLSKLLILRII